jgi:hypothetical protein
MAYIHLSSRPLRKLGVVPFSLVNPVLLFGTFETIVAYPRHFPRVPVPIINVPGHPVIQIPVLLSTVHARERRITYAVVP